MFLSKNPDRKLLEIVTTGERARDLAVWLHDPIKTAAADTEIHAFYTVLPDADFPCPR